MRTKTAWKVLYKGMVSNADKNFKWKKGVWKEYKGKVKIGDSGLHASRYLIDAIKFATPYIVCKVEYDDVVEEQDDKFVCRKMRVIKTYRVTKKQWVEFSIYCAKSVYKNWLAYDKTDKRPLRAIKAAEDWLKSPTKKNLKLAESAALSARSASG